MTHFLSLDLPDEDGSRLYMRHIINLDHVVRASRSDPNGGKTAGDLYYHVWLIDGTRLRIDCDNYEDEHDPFVVLEHALEGHVIPPGSADRNHVHVTTPLCPSCNLPLMGIVGSCPDCDVDVDLQAGDFIAEEEAP